MASNIEELVIAKMKTLGPEQQEQVLNFVERLGQRGTTGEGEPRAEGAKTIWDEIELLSKDIPAEEWAMVPTDLSENIDHYLYGAPKKR